METGRIRCTPDVLAGQTAAFSPTTSKSSATTAPRKQANAASCGTIHRRIALTVTCQRTPVDCFRRICGWRGRLMRVLAPQPTNNESQFKGWVQLKSPINLLTRRPRSHGPARLTLVPLCTAMNYQYYYSMTTRAAISKLYHDGGWPRLPGINGASSLPSCRALLRALVTLS